MGFIEDAFRTIGSLIDLGIYNLIELLFRLIMDLANLEIFSDSVISEFSNRIYIILGLVMLFKIMISFLQILINPDKMDDKEQGMGNILKRVIISLGLIVLVPWIFDFGRDVQNELIPVIPKVVLGKNTEEGDMEAALEAAGRNVAWFSFSTFFTYYPGCDDGSLYNGTNPDTAIVNTVATAHDYIRKKNCPESSHEDGYRYRYGWPLTTVVGVYLLFVFIILAKNVAIRAIKLAICEFIAPIPIASYVDPKTSKQAFDNWVSTSWKTYIDLFVNLVIVYFIIFVFTIVFDASNITQMYGKLGGDWGRVTLVTLFIIIGLFQFAKEAPKFITGMLGIKDGGLGSIGSLFKDAWGTATGTARAIGRSRDIMESNAVTQYERSRAQGKGKLASVLRAAGSSVAGVGAFNARVGLNKLKGKSGKDLIDTAYKGTTGARDRRIYNQDVVFANDDYTRSDYRKEKRRQAIGIPSKEEYVISKHKSFSNMLSAAEAMKKHGAGKMYDEPDSLQVEVGGYVGSLAEFSAMAARREGETYNGELWTKDKVKEWHNKKQLAEKKAQYVREEQLLRSGDSNAILNFQNLATNVLKDINNLREEESFNTFVTNYNSKVTEDKKITTFDQLERLFSLDETHIRNLTAGQIQGINTALEVLNKNTSVSSSQAEGRKQAFKQASDNNGK